MMVPLDERQILNQSEVTERQSVFDELWFQYTHSIRRMAQVRLSPMLRGRLDPSDIVQETYMEANRTLDQFLAQGELPLGLWLRKLAGQKIIQAHRTHLEAQKRSVLREVSIGLSGPGLAAGDLAQYLSAHWTSPSEHLRRQETSASLERGLGQMDELDREILTLRHFEKMTSREVAEILQMSDDAIKKRYVRALDKLQRIMMEISDVQ